MGVKHDLQFSIRKFLQESRQGSYSTQAGRRHILKQFAADLVALGYGLKNIKGIKEKHILSIVEFWQKKQLSVSTIKNRMSALRFLCNKLNKNNIVPTNDKMGIGRRKYVPESNKAIFNPDFSKITNDYVYISMQLQRVFGIRREESLKIKPHMADKGSQLELFPTWCKGGRGRFIPIRTDEQRYWLEQAKNLVGEFGNSLIPDEKNYIQQCQVYEKQVNRSGLRKLHGLRHAYAQDRYKELTGWDAPINNGIASSQLTKEQKALDRKARLILSEELGHSRRRITVSYIGK